VDLASGELRPLGVLARAIGETEHINHALKKRLGPGGEWFAASLPPVLKELSELRNPAAHSEAVSCAKAKKIRDRILGVGGPAILSELGRLRAP